MVRERRYHGQKHAVQQQNRRSDPHNKRLSPRACSLLLANRCQETLVRTAEFLQNLKPALVPQQPAERFQRVGVLEVETDALTALDIQVLAPHGGRNVPRRAEIARHQMEPLVAIVLLVVEADLAILLSDPHTTQQRANEL